MIKLNKSNSAKRPLWVNEALGFCSSMTLFISWDIFIKPMSVDEEVWIGHVLHGWIAKIGGVFIWMSMPVLHGGFDT